MRPKPYPARPRMTPDLIARCKAARASGLTYQQVAAKCGCSLSTAWKACQPRCSNCRWMVPGMGFVALRFCNNDQSPMWLAAVDVKDTCDLFEACDNKESK